MNRKFLTAAELIIHLEIVGGLHPGRSARAPGPRGASSFPGFH
jgi:hypothetical protein